MHQFDNLTNPNPKENPYFHHFGLLFVPARQTAIVRSVVDDLQHWSPLPYPGHKYVVGSPVLLRRFREVAESRNLVGTAFTCSN